MGGPKPLAEVVENPIAVVQRAACAYLRAQPGTARRSALDVLKDTIKSVQADHDSAPVSVKRHRRDELTGALDTFRRYAGEHPDMFKAMEDLQTHFNV